MRKHLIGLALFVLIVSTFAVVRILIEPSPTLPEVPPVRIDNVSFSVRGAYYDVESGEFVSDLKIVWDGSGARPDSVWVWHEFVGDDSTLIAAGLEQISDPFRDARTVSLLIHSVHSRKPGSGANLYGRFEVANSNELMRTGLDPTRVSSPQQVIFIHGDASVIKK